MTTAPKFNRYVAIGDSTTEGVDDPYPGHQPGSEIYRGWADRLAERLAEHNPQMLYANLAVRGRLIGEIHDEQMPAALELEPDLISVAGGVNDLLRPGFEIEAFIERFDSMITTLSDSGATVLVMTMPDLSESMRIARLLSDRLEEFNQAIRDLAAVRGAIVADLATELSVYDPRGWSPDRLHASPIGHEYLMLAAAKALGVPGAAEQLEDLKGSAEQLPSQSLMREYAGEAVWFWQHLRPWIARRVKGISSGDGISAKRPGLEPVTGEDLSS